MFAAAEARAGASLRVGTVDGLLLEDAPAASAAAPPAVRGVRLADGAQLEADVVVLAMGPWTSAAAAWGLPLPPMYGQKYHSVLMRPAPSGGGGGGSGGGSEPPPLVLSQAVFFQGLGDPEVYPRPDGDVYVTGFPDPPAPMSEAPGEVAVRADVCERLEGAMRAVSSAFGAGATTTVRQACHLPVSADGLPVIGAVPGAARGTCFVAAGHSCWGILNAPATGLAVAELILDGGESASIDLAPFDPRRFVAPSAA